MYYQIDGGSENVAKVVFLICELLVARRLTKRVVLSRLMVGHTHCDVDAKFGQLWVSMRVSKTFVKCFICTWNNALSISLFVESTPLYC